MPKKGVVLKKKTERKNSSLFFLLNEGSTINDIQKELHDCSRTLSNLIFAIQRNYDFHTIFGSHNLKLFRGRSHHLDDEVRIVNHLRVLPQLPDQHHYLHYSPIHGHQIHDQHICSDFTNDTKLFYEGICYII